MMDERTKRLLENKITSINTTLGAILGRPGSPTSLIEEATTVQEQATQLQHELTQMRSAAQQGLVTESGVAELQKALDRAKDKADDLHRRANAHMTVAAVQAVKSDRVEFEKAQAYHRRQATIALIATLLAGALALFAALWLFGIIGESGKLEIADHAQWTALTAEIIAKLGGRITVIFAFGWLIKFLGDMHGAHAEQAVYYTDRLSGLAATEFSIGLGDPSLRELVIRKMVNAYISQRENAFRVPVSSKTDGVSVKDAIRMVRILRDMIQPSGKKD